MNRFQWNDLDIEARTGEAAHKQEAHSFLVYYDGGAAGEAALASAIDFLEPNASILVVAWSPVKSSRANRTRRAEIVLAEAVSSAARRGISIQTEILNSSDLGRALVERAKAQGADIIFWGVERSEVERELDPAAEHLLRFSPAKVVLVGV